MQLKLPNNLLPVQVFCLGNDQDPATQQDIEDAITYLETHKTLPKDWPKKVKKLKVRRGPLPGNWLLLIGSTNRPVTALEMDCLRKQLMRYAHEQSLTIVTHHCFNMIWVESGTTIVNCSLSEGE